MAGLSINNSKFVSLLFEKESVKRFSFVYHYLLHYINNGTLSKHAFHVVKDAPKIRELIRQTVFERRTQLGVIVRENE